MLFGEGIPDTSFIVQDLAVIQSGHDLDVLVKEVLLVRAQMVSLIKQFDSWCSLVNTYNKESQKRT